MKEKKILYIGGFEMPDKNAAAQRVLSIGKALKKGGNTVIFYGITKNEDYQGKVDDFDYYACSYPTSKYEWVKYSIGEGVVDIIKRFVPDVVITYNYPAIAQQRVLRYCHKHGIRVIGDITEWYEPADIIKTIDTWLRMHWSNKNLDGLIPISSYLYNYYKGMNQIEIPPLVDLNNPKWSLGKKPVERKESDSTIRLIYAGSNGVAIDRLDYIIKGIESCEINNISLDVIGMTEQDYYRIYKSMINKSTHVCFHGRISHDEVIRYLHTSDFQIFFRDNRRVCNAGFPTKFAESFSAGLPVITNRVSNISDYIENGRNSFMIEEPTEALIKEVLQTVSSLSRNNIDAIKQNVDRKTFDYNKYVTPLSAFIDSLTM